MKLRNLIAAAGILASLGFASAASAAVVTIQLNSLNPITVPPVFSVGPDANFTSTGSNTALYEFDLASAMTVTDASFTNSNGLFTINSIKIYNGYGTATPALGDPSTILNSAHPGHAPTFGSLDELTLAAGKYTIAVDGSTASSVKTTLGSSISFSAAVPEPASWAMMIAGLGCIGMTLRSRKSAAVAA